MTGALSLFPAGSPRLPCLTFEHLYNLVILQPTRFRGPIPRSTCPGGQLLYP